ncbi:MAG: hypothetical protein HDT25_01555 [Ruminococcus sp.]|nr:hypothetical protein [Ruminococcus sp.]
MKYQNDPTKPDYNPSPQERFRFNYHLKCSVSLFISIVLSNLARFLLNGNLNGTGKFGVLFSLCVSGAVLIYAAINMILFFELKKKPEKLEELYRQYSDERNVLIREKVSGGSFTALVFIICIAMMIFSYISKLVTFVLAGLLLVMFLVRLILKLYYEKKY